MRAKIHEVLLSAVADAVLPSEHTVVLPALGEQTPLREKLSMWKHAFAHREEEVVEGGKWPKRATPKYGVKYVIMPEAGQEFARTGRESI